MADTNFLFPSTLRKAKAQTYGGVGNLEFCCGTIYHEMTAIFPFNIHA